MHAAGSSEVEEGKSLRDDERNIVFKFLGSAGYGKVYAFRLTQHGHVIPVQASKDRVPTNPEELVYSAISVSGTMTTDSYGVPPFEFDSREEKSGALLVAIECLLVFGGHYDGLTTKYTYFADSGNKRFALNDFGY